MRECNTSDTNQRWVYLADSTLLCEGTGLCLNGGSNGVKVDAITCDKSRYSYEEWTITPVSDNTTDVSGNVTHAYEGGN